MIRSKKDKKETLKNESTEIPVNDETAVSIENEQIAGEKRIAELEKAAENYKDQVLRKAAEFENYKRRTEAEITNVYRYANEGLIAELLPVLDDFERIKKSWDETHDTESLKKGIELVYDKFKKVLDKQGLKEIDALGKKFDVNLHEAIMQASTDEVEPDTITNVVENGYWLKDKVLRHSKVVVSAKAVEEK